jgi:hypothetical protein
MASALPPPPTKPIAPGSWTNCSHYDSVRERPVVVDRYLETLVRTQWQASDYFCLNTARLWGATLGDFLAWNPSLINGQANSNCTMLPQYRYCVAGAGTSVPEDDLETVCVAVDSAAIKPGTASDCSCYTKITWADLNSELLFLMSPMTRLMT